MRLALPIGVLLVAITAGAVAVAVWASVADAPWEDNGGKDDEGTASLLCEDALERRKAVEDALQKPVTLPQGQQLPLSAMRGIDPGDPFSAFSEEVARLESKLPDIERDIQRFC